jgi:hypothetical protein
MRGRIAHKKAVQRDERSARACSCSQRTTPILFEASTATPLFSSTIIGSGVTEYDVTPDGTRFLMTTASDDLRLYHQGTLWHREGCGNVRNSRCWLASE